MSRLSKNQMFIGFWILTFLAHALILFAVIPMASQRLRASYNQNEYTDGYDLLANNLADGLGYRMYPDTAPTLMREPGYPLLLAGIFCTFGNNFTVVKLANMLMAFLVAWLITRLASEFSTSRVVLLGAPLVFLFHPGTLVAESRGGVELLFTLMLTLFICSFYAALKQKAYWSYALSGAVLGLTVLVRSIPLLFPLFLLAYLLVRDWEIGSAFRALRNVALMVLTMLLVISPWIVRNYSLTGRFVPTASVIGVSAQTGQFILTHHSEDGRRVDREAAAVRNDLARELGYPFRDGYYQCFYSSVDELKFSSFLLKRVAAEYRESPGLFARVLATNVLYFWVGGKTTDSIKLNFVVQLPFLLLAIVGIARGVRGGQLKLIAPILLLIVYSIGVSAPILAQARYSVPLVPYLAIYVCIPFAAANERFRRGELALIPAGPQKNTDI